MLRFRQILNENIDKNSCGFWGSSLHILKDRYMLKGENVKTMFERISTYVSDTPEFQKYMFELFKNKCIMVSSTFAAERNDEISRVACKLVAPSLDNDYKTLNAMVEAYTINTRGTGIGVDISMVPKNTVALADKLKASIPNLMRYYDGASLITIMARKPKTALYTHIHCDNVEPLLTCRSDRTANCPTNVFIGLMINEFFMDCVKNNETWYMFPGDRVPLLHTAHPSEYARIYGQYVCDTSIPRVAVKASDLYHSIINAIITVGVPYIINIDFANEFNNQYGIGPVRTFNLCAEVAGVATPESSTDCVLASINVAGGDDYIIGLMREQFKDDFGIGVTFDDFRYKDLCEYCYYLSRSATRGLNIAIKNKPRREIGVSPLGFSDYLLKNDELYSTFDDIVLCCQEMSEAIYMGAVIESLIYAKETGIVDVNYYNTKFSEGLLQFDLRKASTRSRNHWDAIKSAMKSNPMANSMLTCQAPTVTTSSILGVNESILLPNSASITKLDTNSRQMYMYDGFSKWCDKNKIILENDDQVAEMFESHKLIKILRGMKNEWIGQYKLYAASAPFIDHSQSVTYNTKLDHKTIHSIIMKSREGKLKTGLYYAQMLNPQNVMLSESKSIKNPNKRQKIDCSSCTM